MGLRRKTALVPSIPAVAHPVFTGTLPQPLPSVPDCPCGLCPAPLYFPPGPCFPSQGPLSLPVPISAAASEVEGLCSLPSLETPPCSLPKFCLISLSPLGGVRPPSIASHPGPASSQIPLRFTQPPASARNPGDRWREGPGTWEGDTPRRCAWEGAGSWREWSPSRLPG